MSSFGIVYGNESPGLRNPYLDATHKTVEDTIQKYFLDWHGFFAKYKDYKLFIFVYTRKNVETLEFYGPSIVRKSKIIEFSIRLPVKINDVNHYLDLIFSGIAQAVSRYQVTAEEIEKIKEECKRKLSC